MGIPVVETLFECTDWSKTVKPYLPQMHHLPQQILQSGLDLKVIKTIYLANNPLITGFVFSLALGPVFLAVSEITKNYSQVDRMWSILPTLYNLHFVVYAHMSGLATQRLHRLLVFSILWSLRLTFNYWRRGGYRVGFEDYRWAVVKNYLGPARFFFFNVTFISVMQSVLAFSITTPTYIIVLAASLNDKTDTADITFPCILLSLVMLEWIADQQQWNFQNAKAFYHKTSKVPHHYRQEDLDRGFIVDGLWSWCRHPNFAAEQAIWVTLYIWSCFVTRTVYNWSAISAILILALFQASTWLTELLSAKKYPEYARYQENVGMFIPKIFRVFSV